MGRPRASNTRTKAAAGLPRSSATPWAGFGNSCPANVWQKKIGRHGRGRELAGTIVEAHLQNAGRAAKRALAAGYQVGVTVAVEVAYVQAGWHGPHGQLGTRSRHPKNTPPRASRRHRKLSHADGCQAAAHAGNSGRDGVRDGFAGPVGIRRGTKLSVLPLAVAGVARVRSPPRWLLNTRKPPTEAVVGVWLNVMVSGAVVATAWALASGNTEVTTGP
jgi:hypothetical protein